MTTALLVITRKFPFYSKPNDWQKHLNIDNIGWLVCNALREGIQHIDVEVQL